jgi:glycosyltransferase involved in cell wall biosynthesis
VSSEDNVTVQGPLVSVVTPVHNGEKHLGSCIESIVRQTYESWEYVIVDNRSTDGTRELAESFASSDPRIRYEHHDEFVEVVASYNRAFASISPDSVYCKAMGADDWIYPECLERMVECAEAHPSVGIVSAYRLVEDQVELDGLPHDRSLFGGREIVAQSLAGTLSVLGSPTSTLLRSDLVRSRNPFNEVSFRHADTEAAYWVLQRSDLGFVHQVLTFTRRPEQSELAHSRQLDSLRMDHIRALLRYGPQTLEEGEYRGFLRLTLGKYVWWIFKQTLKPWLAPSRRRDAAFWAYHREAADLVLAESPNDADVRRAIAFAKRLMPAGPSWSS